MADLSALSDATLQQLANGQMPDPSKLSDQELEFLSENPPDFGGPKTGKVESFARGAVNNFPLAPQAVAALEPGSYSENLAEWNKAAQAAKAANPKTYGAGAVTGALAPLAVPYVGPALKASPIAGNALLGAAGAVSNTDVLQHPLDAAKEAVMGGAIGAGTAGILGKVLPTGEGMSAIADREAVKTAGFRPGAFAGASEPEIAQAGQFIRENGLAEGPLADRVKTAQDLVKTYGKQLEDMGANALPGQAVDTAPLIQKAAPYVNSSNKAAKALFRDYSSGVKDLQSLGDKPTFQQLQDMKEMYGKLAFNPDHTVKNEAAKDVYFQLKDAITKTIQSSPEEYQQALHGYSLASDVQAGLEKQHGIHVTTGESHAGVGGHGLHSLIKQVPGVTNPKVSIPVGAGLAAMGHPVIGATLGIHSLMATPQARVAAAEAIGSAAPTVGAAIKAGSTDAITSSIMNRLQTNPKSLGKFAAPLMQSAQTSGSKGLAATHFILANQYPEYNDMMLKAGEENEAGQ